jgi:uncharacterized NAD(P)/FAD-binding protein YdhS
MEHESASNDDIRDEIFRLLLSLKRGESICPTDAARNFGAKWRQLMPHVREVVVDMARDGQIEVTMRGQVVDVDEVDIEDAKGPLRVRLVTQKPEDQSDSEDLD